jgi:hypothetical protein
MSNIFKKKGFSLLGIKIIILGIVFISSCKENTILPPDLVPPIDNINTFLDTSLTVITNNIYQDSVLTGGLNGSTRISNSSSYYHALGVISDMNFGKMVAGFHTEVLPPNNLFSYKGTNVIVDSIILAIPYRSSFGDTLNAIPQTFNVYRSLKSFSRDSAQFETTKDEYDPSKVLASQQVNFNTFKTDSPSVATGKLIPQLRFKLADWFKDSLKAQIDLGANGAMATNATYNQWWKGFYVAPADSNTGNTIGYFNTYGTRMYIYYRYTNTGGTQDTTNSIFGFDANNSNRFCHITRNYTGSKAYDYINTNNTAGDSMLFLQSEPGIAALLRFPNLTTIGNHIVNKAELTFNCYYPTSSMTDTIKAGLIPRLQVFQMDETGTDKIVSDYATFGTNFVDGKRYQVSFLGMTFIQYRFALTETFQKAISQKNTTFSLKIMGLNAGTPGAYQSLLIGSSSSLTSMKPRLNLIYTKIK